MTDEQAAAVIPHAIRVAVAVAHGDPAATATALDQAARAAEGNWSAVAVCLADLATSAEGAAVRVEVRLHQHVGQTLDALTTKGLLPP